MVGKTKNIISVSVNEQVLRKFDIGRGLAPRSAAIERLMEGFNRGLFKLEAAGGQP